MQHLFLRELLTACRLPVLRDDLSDARRLDACIRANASRFMHHQPKLVLLESARRQPGGARLRSLHVHPIGGAIVVHRDIVGLGGVAKSNGHRTGRAHRAGLAAVGRPLCV